MTPIKYGTRHLLITCFHKEDSQFSSLYDLCCLLGKKKGFSHHNWRNRALFLRRRRVLEKILFFGHGAEHEPCVSDDGASRIYPRDISVNDDVELYFCVCHQGAPGIRAGWADSLGLGIERIYGCRDVTETALTIIFLLHILEEGGERLRYWYETWLRVNEYFRVHFPWLISEYGKCKYNFRETLLCVSRRISLAPFHTFLKIADRYPCFLNGISMRGG